LSAGKAADESPFRGFGGKGRDPCLKWHRPV
jgi:hypothetical protein